MASIERTDASVNEDGAGQRLLSLRELFAAVSAISSKTHLDDLLPDLAQFMAGSIGAQRCSVYLYNADLSGVTNHYRWGYTAAELAILEEGDPRVSPLEIPAERHVITTRQILRRIVGEVDDGLMPVHVRWHDIGWRGDMVVPISWNDRIEGVAIIHLPDESERFDPIQVEIARGVAQQAAGVINHLRALDSERELRRQTEMLLESSRIFNSAAFLDEIYTALATSIREMLGTDAVSIVVQDPSDEVAGHPSTPRLVGNGLRDDEELLRNRILAVHSGPGATNDGIAVTCHEPVILDVLDANLETVELLDSFRQLGVTEVLAAPIEVGDVFHGVVYSWSRQGSVALDSEMLPIVGTIVRHAAASIERVRLVEFERVQRERAEALDVVAPKVLSQIATEISQLTNLYPFLHRVQEIICEELRYDDVHIFLVNETDDQLVLAASTDHSGLVGRYSIDPGEGLTGHAIQHRQVINCGDIGEDPRALPTDLATRSLLVVPLIVDDQVIGALGTGSAEPDRFGELDVTLMVAIAAQIAPTIRVAQLHDHVKQAATTDGLTGLMNHRGFYQRLEEMISRLDRWDDDLHLLIVDVIGLKAVNDVHGHLAGDHALKAIAVALKSRVRAEDDVARYGGDEFVVIVRGTPRAGLTELVERLVAPVELTLDDGTQMTIRLRSGVATAHSANERAAELVARADARLYSNVSPTVRADES